MLMMVAAGALQTLCMLDLSPQIAPQASASLASRLPPDAAARRLIEALVERGVDSYFGIPGGPVCPVFEAIRLTPGARLIESRHETHAAFAAALYGRASGRVAAVVATAGPGITNAVTGIASASLERVPLLVIVDDVAWATSGGCMAQDCGPEGIDVEALLARLVDAQPLPFVTTPRAKGIVSERHPRSLRGGGMAASTSSGSRPRSSKRRAARSATPRARRSATPGALPHSTRRARRAIARRSCAPTGCSRTSSASWIRRRASCPTSASTCCSRSTI
jgi:hypothetical protein